jgi:UDPglucose--hexose-1-phosphate uridylyltransferase
VDLRELQGKSHRRYNPLTRDWILVSPNRNARPWQGQTEKPAQSANVQYDPSCYLCPGNARAGGVHNPKYSTTFVFDNDFASLQADLPGATFVHGKNNLLTAMSESGRCRVLCFSPRHDLTLSQMSTREIGAVIEVWAEEYKTLGELPYVNHVQIFENRGAMMGSSNSHPHGQIWATQSIPNEPRKEQQSFEEYERRHGGCLLCDYLQMELEVEERVVCQNDCFIALVPFWAIWPFETLVISKRHAADITVLNAAERAGLAELLKRLNTRYDNLFQTYFPYSMGFHQRPTDGGDHPEWHFHGHFYPPLLRSAAIKKFMVGFELLASPQRDVTPELAAKELRDIPEQRE